VDTLAQINAFKDRNLVLLSAIGKQAGVAVERARLFDRIEKFFLETVQTLVATIEAKDTYTKGHSERVTYYSLKIAEELG
jgi:HD-GYP domain-containing protein (c-di-GMP phosphodiesterase class II)